MKEVSLDKPIASGRTADIYDWDEGHVLKLFHNWFELQDIEYELKIAQAVHASGVKSPAVGELMQIDGRNGLIYERVEGQSMLDIVRRKPWKVFQYGRMLAELHAQMHGRVASVELPEQKSRLVNKIRLADALPASLQTSLLGALISMPGGDRVCHGDFHFGNVMLTQNGGTIIDWIDASRGNPLADVARTSILLLGVAENQVHNAIHKIFVRGFHDAYLSHYFSLHPTGMGEYRRWLPIVAGARLSEGITELEKWLVMQAGY